MTIVSETRLYAVPGPATVAYLQDFVTRSEWVLLCRLHRLKFRAATGG